MELIAEKIFMQIVWKILAKLGKMGSEWARKKVRNKIENEIQIDTEGKLHLIKSDYGLPPVAAILQFKVTNMSDFSLNPNFVGTWIINRCWQIGKAYWFRQEIEGKDNKKEREHHFGFVLNNRGFDIIPRELPSKSHNISFELCYPLPVSIDVEKIDGLGLNGIIEFSYDGINIVKVINVGCRSVK